MRTIVVGQLVRRSKRLFLKGCRMSSKTHASANIADRDTPLIKNCWYVLDRSTEIGPELKSRTVLNQSLVYFRTKDGRVSVLQNRCAHRCFPLSKGKLNKDDTIQCGYHGLTYNTEGKCVHIPSAISMSPSSISVQSYPVVEKAPAVWVWTGDPDKADPSLIPNYDWINGNQWGYGSGFFRVKANYLTIHENLMDITHFQFLHGSALGTPKHAEALIEVTVKGSTVNNFRINEGETVPDLHRDATGLKDAIITRHAHSTFVTPGYHEALGLFEDKEGTNNGRVEYRPSILHFITPETQYTFSYWWFFARDFSAPDSELDEWYSKTTGKVFEEDKDAIEWIEEQWATDHRPEFKEKHVPADEGAVKMRRIVHKLAMEEAI